MKIALLMVVPLLATSLQAQRNIPITIETTAGVIEAELDSVHAPITVTNFLKYVDDHAFDGGAFFRTVRPDNQPNDSIKIEVIQSRAAPGSKRYPAITLERTNLTTLKHHDGVLSMARSGPETGTNQIFIVIGEQPELDFGGKRNPDGQGFAAFGKVTKGMDVVRAIQRGATSTEPGANPQTLLAPVTITRIARRPL